MHATLVAAGPDFRSALRSSVPTGNVDVAPTILHLLGLNPPGKLDGRVLAEALKGSSSAGQKAEPRRIEASAKLENTVWHQYLQISEVNGVQYVDEGNGSQNPAKQESHSSRGSKGN
jgi:arylsulfatase A-like enzyme